MPYLSTKLNLNVCSKTPPSGMGELAGLCCSIQQGIVIVLNKIHGSRSNYYCLFGMLFLILGSSPQTVQYNLPRRCLRHFFAVRKCFVFPRPASTQNMRKMEELTEKDLDSEFLEQANTFCHYIFDSAKPKTVSGGRIITGTGVYFYRSPCRKQTL